MISRKSKKAAFFNAGCWQFDSYAQDSEKIKGSDDRLYHHTLSKNCRAGKKHSKRITKNAADAFLLHQRRFSDGVCAIILFEISLSFDKVLSAQLQSYNPDL